MVLNSFAQKKANRSYVCIALRSKRSRIFRLKYGPVDNSIEIAKRLFSIGNGLEAFDKT